MAIQKATYLQFGFIRATIDGQEMTVPDDMENTQRQMLAEWVAAGNVITPYAPPVPVPAIVLTYKNDVWRRATDDQIKVIDTALEALDTRERRLWDDAAYIDHADQLFVMLKVQMTAAFGASEADRILAAS